MFQNNQKEGIIFIPTWRGISKLVINDIWYVEASDKHSKLVLNVNKEVESTFLLKEFVELLPYNQFCRIHRKYLINLSYVEEFDSQNSFVLFKNSMRLPVARRRKDAFIKDWMDFFKLENVNQFNSFISNN